MSTETEESVTEASEAEEGEAETRDTEESVVTGKELMPYPKDLMDDTFSSRVSPSVVGLIGIFIVIFFAGWFCWRVLSTAAPSSEAAAPASEAAAPASEAAAPASEAAISVPEVAFYCTALLVGSLLIIAALAMVRSRTAAERRIKDNWYKDQLDDYLARKDRASNNTGTR